MSQGQLVLLPSENRYQAQTSPGKLRGRYYTPDELVELMLDALVIDVGSIGSAGILKYVIRSLSL